MKECSKRQKNTRKGETYHRCLHKEADTYREKVDASVCNSCPLRAYFQEKKSETQLPVLTRPSDEDLPKCEFRMRPPGRPLQCSVTGLETNAEICGRCSKDRPMHTARLTEKVVNYATAVKKWVAAGRPERSDEEVQRLYDEHCSKCSMFDKVRKICNSCGCPSNTDQPALRNKLKMGTEACPLGRFPASV